MVKTVRVKLPIDSPTGTISLGEFIIQKHTAEGVNSPLNGIIDMVAFAAKVADAKNKRIQANLEERSAQDKYDDAIVKTGFGKGQTQEQPDTLIWYVRQAKDILSVIHRGQEEALTPFGFNVVITQTGARRNVRVDLPDKPSALVELAQAIIAHHTTLGAGSPFTAALIDMADFETLTNDINTLLTDWVLLRANVQVLNNDALVTLGYGPGQTSNTPNTIYYLIGSIRNRLLQKHQGREEALTNWGFNVTLNERKAPKGSGNAGLSIKGKVTDSATGEPLGNALVYNTETDTFTVADDQGNYSIPTLPAGVYNLVAHKTGYHNSGNVQVTVVSGQLSTVNFQLNAESGTATGTITGTVTNNGQPYQALLTVTAGNTTVTTHTLASGAFNLAGVPSGVQTIICTPDDNPANLKNQQVTVPDGNSVTADFVYP